MAQWCSCRKSKDYAVVTIKSFVGIGFIFMFTKYVEFRESTILVHIILVRFGGRHRVGYFYIWIHSILVRSKTFLNIYWYVIVFKNMPALQILFWGALVAIYHHLGSSSHCWRAAYEPVWLYWVCHRQWIRLRITTEAPLRPTLQ